MAIQVWDGTKYVGAELAKFGPSGTLKEASIWDGTKYVEVWTATLPSIYPQSGSWGPVAITSSPSIVRASHTIAEAGSYTITHANTDGGNLRQSIIGGPWGNSIGNRVSTGTSTATTTQTLQPGDLITFGAFSPVPSGTATGSWSIVKN